MYGVKVHEAVIAAKQTVTGVTIHIVDEVYDHGPIVAQCEVSVLKGDTAELLAKRVLEREREFWVETLQNIIPQRDRSRRLSIGKYRLLRCKGDARVRYMRLRARLTR